MGPIWPSYFEDCSSVIVCFPLLYCMYCLKKKEHPWSSFDSLCAYFRSSCWTQSTLLRYLRPASSYWLCSRQSCCRPSLCLFCSTRGEAIISRIAISTSLCLDLHNTDIIFSPLCIIIFLSPCINMVMFFTFFQGYALHNEPHRNEVTDQNGGNHCLSTSANYSTRNQCPLRAGT